MKKKQNNSKSITEKNSIMTKVIDIDNSNSNSKIIDFEILMNAITREIHLKICNRIAKSLEKIPEQLYMEVYEEILKSLKIHAEIKVNFSYFEA